VCFQQDLLERAQHIEEEWLPAALEQIKAVVDMRDRSIRDRSTLAGGKPIIDHNLETPIILAYSANPGVTPATITACVSAGAAGVLKPSFDINTARLVRRMVKAAREGRISSVVDLVDRPGVATSPGSSPVDGIKTKVHLPPTELHIGGDEHEGEKVLTEAVASRHRRATSGQIPSTSLNSTPTYHPSERPTPSHQDPPASSQVADPEPQTQQVQSQSHSQSQSQPDPAQRRRSVDIGGLSLALKRAQRAFESTILSGLPSRGSIADIRIGYGQSSPSPFGGSGSSMALKMRKEHTTQSNLKSVKEAEEAETALKNTHLAELLSAMYYQTTVAIDIQMEEYQA
jgi:hypothetical protein